jgi:hypothetical protein
MSKRRNRKQTDLPEATLQRAREQAGLPAAETDDEVAPEAVTTAPAAVVADPLTKPKNSGRQRRAISNAQLERSKQRGELDHETIEYLLEHPTKVVTEAELRETYSHVLADLRNMAVLAAILVVLMMVVAWALF